MTARLTRQEFLATGALGALVATLARASPAAAAAGCQPAVPLVGIPDFRGKDPTGTYYMVPHAGAYDPYLGYGGARRRGDRADPRREGRLRGAGPL
jgi:hypothetical protein